MRRLARPLTAPVDGRVADINRRITASHESADAARREAAELKEAIAGSRRELGSYASAALEASSYVGSEMRRLEDALVEHQSRLFERLDEHDRGRYVNQLATATRTPLEHLDGAVADLVNHANGHRGFAAQAGLWFNPPVTVELSEGHARLADVNERIVEVPFASAALLRLTPGARILDVGAAESTFSLTAASLGYRVTAIDLNQIPLAHPNLEAITGRFEDWDPQDARFDAVFFISTIEHFGMGAYGEHRGAAGADREALDRVRALLSDEGFVVITAPYGYAQVDALERTYDDDGLAALFAGWNVLERHVVVRRDRRTWTAGIPGEEIERGVVMIRAEPDS